MSVFVCCVFIAMCCRLSCSLELVVRCSLVDSSCSSCVVCCHLVVVCFPLRDVRGLSFVVCCELLAVL